MTQSRDLSYGTGFLHFVRNDDNLRFLIKMACTLQFRGNTSACGEYQCDIMQLANFRCRLQNIQENTMSTLLQIPTDELNAYGERIIYHVKDDFGDIFVSDKPPYRNLMFDNIYKQSSLNLEYPERLVFEYTRAMMTVLAFTKPTHITLLGLGGASLLHSLYHLMPQSQYHVIEIREQVYEVAKQFFALPKAHNIKYTINDAKDELKKMPDQSTDMIFSDLYHANGISPFQKQKRFIKQCHRVLNHDAWLVINYHDLPANNSSFFNYLKSYFVSIFACVTFTDNTILLASKKPLEAFMTYNTQIEALEQKLDIKLMPIFKRFKQLV